MPSFPQIDRLDLPCRFERLIPGRLHPDGRRYLPLALLRLPDGFLLGVTDRHHLLKESLVGSPGSTRLVFLLSQLQLQTGTLRRGLLAEPGMSNGQASTAPEIFGRVVEVLTWELRREHLPYDTLFTELILDIGVGTVGLRTNLTSANLAATLGAEQIVPGDQLRAWRSRIDVLEFVPIADSR